MVNCLPKAIATRHGRKSNPRPLDLKSDALTTQPRCARSLNASPKHSGKAFHYTEPGSVSTPERSEEMCINIFFSKDKTPICFGPRAECPPLDHDATKCSWGPR
ncbi:hypothetical protein ElyMa_003217300 [Elysia marginata]|uniref:Uncharacterized protein n=1 Tax=Elysia marginata TaxID=1093978 RepID=A0AAV4J500_9GAST|nr:hypothetical protein ElyMa_003217300 [Elysia marginata]